MPLARIIISLLLLISFCPAAFGADVPLTISFFRHENHVLATVHYIIPDNYHAYSHVSSSSGLPTSLKFSLESAGQIEVFYPAGIEEPDPYDPGAKARIYQGPVTLLAALPAEAAGKSFVARLDMLLCSNRHCLPVKKTINGNIPEAPPAFSENDFPEPALLTQLADFTAQEPGSPSQEAPSQTPPNEGHTISQKYPQGFPPPEEFELELKPAFSAPELEIYSLGKALLFGLIAGLILNAMPCVLPVLALKVNSILMAANISNRKKARLFRKHNLFFAAGVLSLFTALALLLGLADLMWGQLYQNHALLLGMLLLVFLMGLSMLGVFTLPTFSLRMGENHSSPALQAYCSGLLCTFLATPCSGPLLGGVLAWAFTQPLPALLAVFWSVGLGMCLPYLMFSIWPSTARLLPQPGNWMYIFERVLGFLLLGTALYLLSILPEARRMHVLSALLAIAFGAWMWGRFCGLTAPRWRRWLGTCLACLLLVGSAFWILQPQETDTQWQKFEPAIFMDDFTKKNMLVEFTADWCPNCKYLEATALTKKNLAALRKKYKFSLIRVDLTDINPYGEKLLAMLGGKSIPLTALFSKGAKANEPLVLRDIYDQKELADAIRRQF